MNYLSFLLRHPGPLGFGLLFTGFSAFGQTFLIALSGGEIRAEFGLSHGGFGEVYSVATLVSGFTLLWAGRLIDRFPLRRFAAGVCIGLACACLLAAAAPALWALFFAMMGLRFFGQGLMTHTAVTGIARHFVTGRGKALGVASLGMPIGAAVFPPLTVLLIGEWGWRATYAGYGLVMLALVLPAALLLARTMEPEEGRPPGAAAAAARRSWTQAQMLRDPVFWLIIPAALAPAFIVTGFLFHQVHLAVEKGWGLGLWAAGFTGYALAEVAASLAWGPLVDRYGALRLLPFYLPLLGLGLAVLALGGHPAAAILFLAACGATAGGSATIVNATWAELYGTAHLGAIRAVAVSAMILASALSPAALGWMIDAGLSMGLAAWLCLGYVAAGVLALAAASRLALRRQG